MAQESIRGVPKPSDRSEEPIVSPEPESDNGLDELRRLLLSPEQRQLNDLRSRLDQMRVSADEIGRELPEAIVRRPKPDKRLATALMPTVEDALQQSVKRDPQPLIDAVFPIMGVAIRRAIAQALQGLVQSINRTLELSLSVSSLRWRLEAARTGKPFAEVVLAHSLVYRVEQVFLIHKETGLLLQHVASDAVRTPDPESVSGMMTAIGDFVHDAFRVDSAATLDTFQVGDLMVWIEQGPQAFLAVATRGTPPQTLWSMLQDALAGIHRDRYTALESFDGDAGPFDMSRPVLEECLVSQAAEQETRAKKSSWAGRAVGALILLVLVFGLGVHLRDRWRWNWYVQQLEHIPGIVVTRAEAHWRSYEVAGLRDPLAVDPDYLLEMSKLPRNKVMSLWEPYQALYPAFILARARQVLDPPPTVTLSLNGGTLFAVGHAPKAWRERARQIARVIPGISAWREDHLVGSGE